MLTTVHSKALAILALRHEECCFLPPSRAQFRNDVAPETCLHKLKLEHH